MKSRKYYIGVVIAIEIVLASLIAVLILAYPVLILMGSQVSLIVISMLVIAQLVMSVGTSGLNCEYSTGDAVKASCHVANAVIFSFYYEIEWFPIFMFLEFAAFFFEVAMALVNSRKCTKVV